MERHSTVFEIATEEDKEEILALYRSLIGTEFCVWTESYPGMEEIEYDLSREALFCMRDNERIVGVISLDLDEQVDRLTCWSRERQPSVELSRLGVHKDYQNRGIAGDLILNAMNVAGKRGMKSIRFLVAKSNVKALKAYKRLHCDLVGECFLYGADYWCYEKDISSLTEVVGQPGD